MTDSGSRMKLSQKKMLRDMSDIFKTMNTDCLG